MDKIIVLLLTCVNKNEAQTIADRLLAKRLAACVKMMPINAQFLWQGTIEKSSEELLIIDSIERNIPLIEQEIAAIHSYELFSLMALPALYTPTAVEAWIKESCT